MTEISTPCRFRSLSEIRSEAQAHVAIVRRLCEEDRHACQQLIENNRKEKQKLANLKHKAFDNSRSFCRPNVRLAALLDTAERRRDHAQTAVRKRNLMMKIQCKKKLLNTSVTRNTKYQRDAALVSWLKRQIAYNPVALRQRWLCNLKLSYFMHMALVSVEKKKKSLKAANKFQTMVLISARMKKQAKIARQKIATDLLIRFLQDIKHNKVYFSWTSAAKKTRKCVQCIQRRWREKLLCRAAHFLLLKHQLMRAIGTERTGIKNRQGIEEAQLIRRDSSSTSIEYSDTDQYIRREIKIWQTRTMREYIIAHDQWRRFSTNSQLRHNITFTRNTSLTATTGRTSIESDFSTDYYDKANNSMPCPPYLPRLIGPLELRRMALRIQR